MRQYLTLENVFLHMMMMMMMMMMMLIVVILGQWKT